MARRQEMYTELNERLDEAANEGAFNDIDPNLIRLMHGITPTSVSFAGRLAVPESYDPNHGPALLMTHPGEACSVNVRDVARLSLNRVVTNHRLSKPDFAPDIRTHDQHTLGKASGIDLRFMPWTLDSKPQTDIRVPIVITLRHDDAASTTMPASVISGLSQWDFYLYTDLYDPMLVLPHHTVDAMRERRVQAAVYTVEQNIGCHKDMPTVAELASPYQTYDDPEQLGPQIRKDVIEASKKAGQQDILGLALAAVTLSRMLAEPESGALTIRERMAYKAAGLI